MPNSAMRHHTSSRTITPISASRVAALGRNAVQTVGRTAQEAAQRSVTFARAHPAATAGALAGVAMLVGAFAHSALQREPTLGEIFGKTVRRRASQLSRLLASRSKRGIDAAAAALSNALD